MGKDTALEDAQSGWVERICAYKDKSDCFAIKILKRIFNIKKKIRNTWQLDLKSQMRCTNKEYFGTLGREEIPRAGFVEEC